MKRSRMLSIIFLTIILIVSFVVTAGAQDKNTAKKQVVKAVKNPTHDHKPGSKECLEKHNKGECQGHEAGKCDCSKGEKHNCCDKASCLNCKDKHASGECKNHQSETTKKTNQVKKDVKKEKK